MSDNDLRDALLLLELFDAERLGDGNLTAGANTLAAMALTIANVQRPGVGVFWRDDGSRIAVGSSFVMVGSLGSSLVAEHLVGPLMACRDSLFANVRHFEETIKREGEVAVLKGRPLDGLENLKQMGEPILRQLARPAMCQQLELGRAEQLLEKPPGWCLREARERPLVFGHAETPAAIERMMEPAHLGSPLLHLALHEPGECQGFAKACNRLLDGCHLPQSPSRTIRGKVMVTDSASLLEGALRTGGAGAGWLSRMPWLLDHAPGPAFARVLDPSASGRLRKVISRFSAALREAWAERLSDACAGGAVMSFDFSSEQRKWVSFLTGHEASFPGITGMLRPLYASLLYGLSRMARLDSAVVETFNKLIHAIQFFARMLAQRMLNARSGMLHDSARARVEALADSIRIKLECGPLTVREIVRRFHRLTASTCEHALDILCSSGQVRCIDNRWELTRGASAPAAALAQPLTLDV